MFYNTIDEGYNIAYTYRDKKHTFKAIKENAEYIISCLKNQGIRFKIETTL